MSKRNWAAAHDKIREEGQCEPKGVRRREVLCPDCGYRRTVYADTNVARCRACSSALTRNGVEVACPFCGKKRYFAAQAIADGHRYCSYECSQADGFGRTSTSPQTRAKLSASKQGARNPNWKGKGGQAPSGRVWNLSLKGETACRRCARQAMHLHHIVPRSKSRAGKMEVVLNGMPLCVKCHFGWHRNCVVIPSSRLTAAEYAFAVEVAGVVWVENRYPGPPPSEEMAA